MPSDYVAAQGRPGGTRAQGLKFKAAACQSQARYVATQAEAE
jgi:hypothetical protein